MSIRLLLILLSIVAATTAESHADEGHPVALVRVANGGIQVQSMGGLTIAIQPSPDDTSVDRPAVVHVGAVDPEATHAINVQLLINPGAELDHIWDRTPNDPQPTWTTSADNPSPSPNAFRVQSFGKTISIKIDGVHLVYASTAQINKNHLKHISDCDALVIASGDVLPAAALDLAKQVNAKRLIVDADSKIDGVVTQPGNTLPLSATSDKPSPTKVIALGTKAVELSPEVLDLISRKEASCRASQSVFATLSTEQMNFRPANGSHTPRWNAEHMMGRELLFFSQIYHAKDPSIPVMDLNPKQMPPDYQAKHPDWTGVEEAMQMERVTAFTQRFAYLLDGLPLDKKAPASRWTPCGLLKQMERHYSEHTANVKLKFKLPGYPKK